MLINIENDAPDFKVVHESPEPEKDTGESYVEQEHKEEERYEGYFSWTWATDTLRTLVALSILTLSVPTSLRLVPRIRELQGKWKNERRRRKRKEGKGGLCGVQYLARFLLLKAFWAGKKYEHPIQKCCEHCQKGNQSYPYTRDYQS